MKEFKSHKTVKAAKIIHVSETSPDYIPHFVKVVTEDSVTHDWQRDDPIFARYMPQAGDYLVEYEGGYQSFSPAQAFEDGYTEISAPATMPSTSDARVLNNVMRHNYRVLSDDEKQQMLRVKDAGLLFYDTCDAIGQSRELSLAKTKVEEAVMWATKHITK